MNLINELIIKNGLILENGKLIQKDIFIKDGKIKEIEINLFTEKIKIIDAIGKIILPGAIDPHVHFREPGGEYKEDWLSGSKAAVTGGVTTVLDMPNNNPPIISQKDIENKKQLAKKSLVNYGIYVGATADNLLDIEQMTDIVGVKVYMGSSTGSLLLDKISDFVKLLENTNKPIVTHCENEDLVKYFSDKNKKTKMHHKMRDNICAAVSIAEATICADYFKKQLHIAHISTKEEVNFLRKYKTDQITCEVCPHHLFLNKDFFCEKGNYGKMNPPLRYQEDQDSLWEAINEGIVDCIATDHAPHTREEKEKDFEHGPCGVPGVQTMLPLMLNAVNEGKTTLQRIQEMCCENPAKIFNLKNKGKLKEGYDADITIVDMNKEKIITDEEQHSKCRWSPFTGKIIKGWPVTTIVNGNIVFNNDYDDKNKTNENNNHDNTENNNNNNNNINEQFKGKQVKIQ